MINAVQMNDWEIKKFLSVILSIQLAIWGSMLSDAVGLQIPFLRQFIGFIYLIFVPGILIIRVLKLHNLGNIQTILFTVGLSIAILMFTGFFMNMIYPFFGIFHPISLTPLMITISTVVLFLCVMSYIKDKDFANPSFVDLGEVFSPPALFVCLIPFMAAFGTHLVNYHQSNILLMFMIVMIAIIALLVAFNKFIPNNLYSFTIFIIVISLIFHRSLISPMYINEHDMALIYSYINSIIINSKWDLTIENNYNAALSTVMLAPIFRIICETNLIFVFNIIYYSFCPITYLGLYSIFQRITDDKIAFLSVFYLVSLLKFPGPYQLIAEIFLVSLIMLTTNKKIDVYKKKFLSVIFAISLVVSHYGTSYLFMFSLIFVLLLFSLTEKPMMRRIWEKIYDYIIGRKSEIGGKAKADNIPLKKSDSPKEYYTSSTINDVNNIISKRFILLFIVFTVTWYMYVSSSSALNMIIYLGDQIANTIVSEFLSPETSRGAELLLRDPASLLHRINKVLQLAIPFLISIGILNVLIKHKETKFEKEYIGFSLYWFGICLASIAIPYFAVMNPERLYRLSLFFMVPFAVIGGITVFNEFRSFRINIGMEQSLKIISIIFAILLLFNTGFIFEIAKDHPNSISLSQDSIKKSEYQEYKALFYIKIIPEEDIFSAKWLSRVMKSDEDIYASYAIGKRALVGYGGLMPESPQIRILSNKTVRIKAGSYIYLSAANTIGRIGIDLNPKLGSPIYFYMSDLYSLLRSQNRIYANGGSDILWSYF